jgi:uncharacterized cupredoxin-like copper-binding protein
MALPTEPTPLEPTPPQGGGTDTTKWWWIIGGVFVGALLIGGLIVLLTSGSGDDSVTTPTNPPTSSTTSTSTPSTTTTTAPVAPGQPTIGQFTAAPSPVTCSGGNPSLSLQWSTQHANNVTIETDGVPQPNTYPPTGSTTLLFNCANPQHNYTLVANGSDNLTARQQLTVQGVTAPTAPPTQPPTTTTTKPPATTTTSEPPDTTTTTNPVEIPVAVTIDDQGNEQDPMTLVADPTQTTAGSIEFTVKNAGQQNHSFVVVQTDLPFDQLPVDPDTNKVDFNDQVVKVGKIAKFGPGNTKQLTLTLEPGTYVLIDNLPGNYALGARAAFTVVLGPPAPPEND